MFILKQLLFLFLIFFISSCSFNELPKLQNKNNFSVDIETTEGKYNVYFKENLKRLFYNKNYTNKPFVLKTTITFQSTETLSVSGLNILKSTKAKINYELRNKETNLIIKSGSIDTFPTMSSFSRSLYSREKNIEHIKERLTIQSANSLYMHIINILRRLS